jgi:hypothetical protein
VLEISGTGSCLSLGALRALTLLGGLDQEAAYVSCGFDVGFEERAFSEVSQNIDSHLVPGGVDADVDVPHVRVSFRQNAGSRPPDELGFADEEPAITSLPAADLGEMLTRASAVTSSAIADLQRQVDGLRTLDRQLGSPAVVEPTRQLVQTMQELMAHVFAGGTREALAVVLSDAAALNAWQVLNT